MKEIDVFTVTFTGIFNFIGQVMKATFGEREFSYERKALILCNSSTILILFFFVYLYLPFR